MKVTIIGIRPVSFTANDGKEINGTSLYVAYDANGVEGMATDRFFVTAEKMPEKGFKVGGDVDLLFNRFGKVDRVIA